MIFLAIYVDDILITGNDPHEIHNLKTYLHSVFSIKDLGKLHYFLGMEVAYTSTSIILHQKKNLQKNYFLILILTLLDMLSLLYL